MGIVLWFTAGVDVDTTDHLIAVEYRVGKRLPLIELAGVHIHVGHVLRERHWGGPLCPIHARSRPDVVDARHPGLMIPFVVHRPKRFEVETPTLEGQGHLE